MDYKMLTKNGYSLFEMSSMLQKAIRRSDIEHAAYAANELSPKYRNYLWKRLLTVSAEDCFGIMTKEIVALQKADEYVNSNAKYGTSDLFIAKAVVLLCMARKNRDADYVACNFMWGDRTLTDEEFEKFVDYKQVEELQMNRHQIVPEYVYDCHTIKGKRKGLKARDMFETENAALEPHQLSLFDFGSFGNYHDHFMAQGSISPDSETQWQKFMNGKETDPTHNGDDLDVKEPNWGKWKM